MSASDTSKSRAGLALLLTSAVSAACIGLIALSGWVLGLPRLASFGADLMPMAPSTAVLFLLFGTAISLRAWMPSSRRSFWISVAAGCLGALAALLLFALSSLNVHWPVERLGLTITGTVGGAPMGHISPVGAFCFLLTSVSFLSLLSQSAIPRWRVILASGSAVLLLGTSLAFLLAYFYGTPLLYGGTFIPPALNTVLAFVLLGISLLVLAGRLVKLFHKLTWNYFESAFFFGMVFFALATGIIVTGWIYYRNYEQHYRVRVEQELLAIADLKEASLTRWRKERLGDGQSFFQNVTFAALAKRALGQPEDPGAQRELCGWLDRVRVSYGYERVLLLDPQGIERLAVPSKPEPTSQHLLQDVAAVLRSGQVTFLDFHRDAPGRPVHLAVLVPIFDESNARQPLGVLVLRIDPEVDFYPFIKRWPTASETGETLLVRREGNEVVFLNELRFGTNTALNLRAPLSRITMPAVQAALGHEGVFEGVDYRGKPVVAALRTIPDSPWAMVTRMDAAEVYERLRSRLWQVVLMIGALLFSAGASVGLAWRQQRIRFLKERATAAETIRETRDYLENLINHANAPIIVWDTKFRITRFNRAFEALTGRKAAEVVGNLLSILFPPGQISNTMALIEKTLAGERWETVEIPILNVDGSVRIVLWNSATIYAADGKTPMATIAQGQDITERKRAEEKLQQNALELQEKNSELERFLYTASHDLKSPVVTVRTFLTYLEQDIAAGNAVRIKKDAGFIRGAADKMALLLDELLEISRVGRVVNAPVRFAFRSLVDEVLGAVAGRIAERGVKVIVDEHDLLLHGDRPRLAEVWQNLVENACKFMGDQKEPRLEIGVETRGAETVFFVRDNGIGIDPRYHTKVFGLFEKLDPKAEGTGLGLALVKRIVEANQGRIWVESAGQGQGACFCFTLPGTVNNPSEGKKL
jgi:PAS domain S-box-containing protein